MKKITRKEFLKKGLSGLIALLAIPFLKLFSAKEGVSHKEASFYKDLAG